MVRIFSLGLVWCWCGAVCHKYDCKGHRPSPGSNGSPATDGWFAFRSFFSVLLFGISFLISSLAGTLPTAPAATLADRPDSPRRERQPQKTPEPGWIFFCFLLARAATPTPEPGSFFLTSTFCLSWDLVPSTAPAPTLADRPDSPLARAATPTPEPGWIFFSFLFSFFLTSTFCSGFACHGTLSLQPAPAAAPAAAPAPRGEADGAAPGATASPGWILFPVSLFFAVFLDDLNATFCFSVSVALSVQPAPAPALAGDAAAPPAPEPTAAPAAVPGWQSFGISFRYFLSDFLF